MYILYLNNDAKGSFNTVEAARQYAEGLFPTTTFKWIDIYGETRANAKYIAFRIVHDIEYEDFMRKFYDRDMYDENYIKEMYPDTPESDWVLVDTTHFNEYNQIKLYMHWRLAYAIDSVEYMLRELLERTGRIEELLKIKHYTLDVFGDKS